MSVLCIIPARGGSKGVPRKNIKKLAGKTLLERAVGAAKQSGVCDFVLVTTDDLEIQQLALEYGAMAPFLRPAMLAEDDTPMIPVLIDAIQRFEKETGQVVDTVVLTETTVPFRQPKHIAEAVSLYQNDGVGSVIGVCPLERKPQNIFIKSDDGLLDRLFKDAPVFTRRQEMDALCRLSSSVYVVGKEHLLTHEKLLVEPIGYVEVDAITSINIDHEIDFMLAEVVANKYRL